MNRSSAVFLRAVAAAVVAVGMATAPELRAETATPGEMARVCRNWLTYVVHERGAWAGDTHPEIAGVRGLTSGDTLLACVFEIRPSGHVVVPLLKDLPPVKAYSVTSLLDAGGEGGFAGLLREGLLDRLRRFRRAYGSLEALEPRGGTLLFERTNRDAWDRLLLDPQDFAERLDWEPRAPLEDNGPLLHSSWHQMDPYDGQCPMGDGGRCLAGCVAVAAAQVMNYYEWPALGVGGRTYYWNGDESCGGDTPPENLSADFSDLYDWTLMPDSCGAGCTPEEEAAVAELCYEVAAAVGTDFGHCSSDVPLMGVLSALPLYFRYDGAIDRENRSDHTAETWFDLIRGEIDAGRPMLYGMRYSSTVNHALVCDGWSDTGEQQFYHVNYGWGGSYTGWYAIDHLYHTDDPLQEYLIRGITPRPSQKITVRPDGTGDFPTIQEALDAAAPGDTVELSPGIFTGTGNREIDLPDRGVVVRSASGNPDSCVLDCEGAGRAFMFYSAGGTPVTLEGITVANGHAAKGGAVFVGATSPAFLRCAFLDNRADESGGAMCWEHNGSPVLSGCTIARNSASKGGGIWCSGASGAALTGCTFADNAAVQGGALHSAAASSVRLENTIIAFSGAGGAVYCDGTSEALLTCSDVYGNVGGDWTGCIQGQAGVDGNLCEDPLFCGRSSGDLTIAAGSPCAGRGRPSGCGLMGAHEVGCDACQRIPLRRGWNSVSSWVAPGDPAMGAVWADLISAGRLDRIKNDCTGESCVPASGCPILWDPMSGYMAHMSAPDTLVICGDALSPEGPVPLRPGWNCVPYLPRVPLPPDEALATCGSELDIIQSNSTGRFCVPGLLCQIEFLNPGESYQVYAAAACTLYFSSRGGRDGASDLRPGTEVLAEHFRARTQTGAAYGVVVRDSGAGMEAGDEVGLFSGNRCVGSAVWGAGPVVGVTVWGDDASTQTVDGCVGGDALSIRVWDLSARAEHEPEIEFVVGDGTYGDGPYALVNVGGGLSSVGEDPGAAARDLLVQNQPNPFNPETAISYELSRSGEVTLAVFDVRGRRVRTLVDEVQGAGRHRILWDGADDQGRSVGPGVYFYRLKSGRFEDMKKMVLAR